MQTTILWTGREYTSLENCILTGAETGPAAESVIIGAYHHTIYRVEYEIRADENWETIFFELTIRHSGKSEAHSFHGDGKGNWTKNGKPAKEFEGCIDIDISLTPFTNTLPVNRMRLPVGESRQIRVLYLDILNRQMRPVLQKYTRLSQTRYKFENVPNDFEAVIAVDDDCLVTDYPGLFEMTEKHTIRGR